MPTEYYDLSFFHNSENNSEEDESNPNEKEKPEEILKKEFQGYKCPIHDNYINTGAFSPGVATDAKHKSGHDGIDFMAPKGTPVYPIAPGVVIAAGSNAMGGNTVNTSHEDGKVKAYYAHMDGVSVKKGDLVDYDTVIGHVSNSGNAKGTCPHLHLQVWRGGSLINPSSLFSVKSYNKKEVDFATKNKCEIKEASLLGLINKYSENINKFSFNTIEYAFSEWFKKTVEFIYNDIVFKKANVQGKDIVNINDLNKSEYKFIFSHNGLKIDIFFRVDILHFTQVSSIKIDYNDNQITFIIIIPPSFIRNQLSYNYSFFRGVNEFTERLDTIRNLTLTPKFIDTKPKLKQKKDAILENMQNKILVVYDDINKISKNNQHLIDYVNEELYNISSLYTKFTFDDLYEIPKKIEKIQSNDMLSFKEKVEILETLLSQEEKIKNIIVKYYKFYDEDFKNESKKLTDLNMLETPLFNNFFMSTYKSVKTMLSSLRDEKNNSGSRLIQIYRGPKGFETLKRDLYEQFFKRIEYFDPQYHNDLNGFSEKQVDLLKKDVTKKGLRTISRMLDIFKENNPDFFYKPDPDKKRQEKIDNYDPMKLDGWDL